MTRLEGESWRVAELGELHSALTLSNAALEKRIANVERFAKERTKAVTAGRESQASAAKTLSGVGNAAAEAKATLTATDRNRLNERVTALERNGTVSLTSKTRHRPQSREEQASSLLGRAAEKRRKVTKVTAVACHAACACAALAARAAVAQAATTSAAVPQAVEASAVSGGRGRGLRSKALLSL